MIIASEAMRRMVLAVSDVIPVREGRTAQFRYPSTEKDDEGGRLAVLRRYSFYEGDREVSPNEQPRGLFTFCVAGSGLELGTFG